MPKPIFISYSTADTATSEQIRDHLEANGIACWMAPRDIAPGEDYAEQIINAIESCAVLLLVLSESSNRSQYVIKEVERAIAKHKVVIPFRIHNVIPSRSLEFFISNAQWIDAWQEPLAAHLTPLVIAVRNQQTAEHDQRNNDPPLATTTSQARRVQSNLPAQLTRFIGRERAITEVQGLLESTRLLTLTGSGGTGKTRLALEVGATALPLFSEGVWLVELAALADGTLVAETVASVFGLAQSNRPMLSVLTHYLHDRHLLLILDNCEHLVQASAGLAESLLRACAGLHILATSREALNIAGEVTWPVSSLAAEEARQLFIDRARAARPDFSLTEGHARAVAQICTRLDNIPLAIELAAARLRTYSAEQIAARLDDAFHLLTGGSRTALPRQQTLYASIDWSYGLLSDEERTLLRCLSVFAGGWSLEAAEALSEGDVLGLLDQLVSKSLVNMDERTGEPRYRMLEMVRQYAYDKLIKSGEVERVRNAHLDFFLRLAQEAQPMLEQTEQGTWLHRLDREHDNFRTALQWSVADGTIESGLRLGAALWLFWFMRGYLSEGRVHLEGLLAAAREIASTSTRAEALNKAGVLARYQGDYDQAYSLISESLAIYRQLESKQGIANALANLGFVALYRGDHRLARSLYGESLTINRELENGQGMADSLSHLAMAALYEGDYATARSLNEESLAIWRNLGDKQGIAWALHILGNVILKQGEYTVAHSVFAESLAISRDMAYQWGLAWSLEDFAQLAILNKQDVCALRLVGAANALREAIGLPQPQPEQAELDHKLESARQALGKGISVAAWAEGQSLTLDQAMAEIAEIDLDETKLRCLTILSVCHGDDSRKIKSV